MNLKNDWINLWISYDYIYLDVFFNFNCVLSLTGFGWRIVIWSELLTSLLFDMKRAPTDDVINCWSKRFHCFVNCCKFNELLITLENMIILYRLGLDYVEFKHSFSDQAKAEWYLSTLVEIFSLIYSYFMFLFSIYILFYPVLLFQRK